MGQAKNSAGQDRAFLFDSTGMRDLNSLIPDTAGWTLVEARGINDAGQIVGYGRHNGQPRAFLLTPSPQADLALSQTATPNPATAGDLVTFTLGLTNKGPDLATGITVTDLLPANTTYVSCAATGGGSCGGTGNDRCITFASLAGGESATIILVARIDASTPEGTLLVNSAMVSAATDDPTIPNNTATVTVTVIVPLPLPSPSPSPPYPFLLNAASTQFLSVCSLPRTTDGMLVGRMGPDKRRSGDGRVVVLVAGAVT